MRFGIIGCGLIGQKRAAAAASGHDIIAVADVELARAKALAARYDVEVATDDWRAVAEADGIDAVLVATPHDMLGPISAAAISAGKDVLVEKPGASTCEEISALCALAARHQATIKVGFNHRFHPAVLKAREIVDSGALGPLMFVRGRYGHGGRPGYETEWRCQPEISGGGELIDQGSHLIDLSRWFLGDFVDVYGSLPTYFWDVRVEDNCFLSLRTDQGQIAWLHASWTEWKNMFSFEIYGREGKLEINGLGGSYGLERLTYYRMLPEMGPPETTIWEYPLPDRSWQREFDEFAAAVAEGRPPIGTIDDAKAVLDIIAQVYDGGRP